MGEGEPKKVDQHEARSAPVEVPNHAAEEKSVIPISDDKVSHAAVQKVPDPAVEKGSRGSTDRDAVLARLEAEKRLALIKAWEESEKTKAENKAYKKLCAVGAWENSKKASVEAQLKKIEEKLEKKKAEYAEKMKNKKAEIHKASEEKRAMIEAKRGEDILNVQEKAAKSRAKGHPPKKIFGCFSGCTA